MNKNLFVAAILAASLTSLSAAAVDLKLNSVTYPDKASVDVPFTRGGIAPSTSALKARVKFEGGQAQIELKWSNMEPAVLFSGNITTYALWAVTVDGRTENLGEVAVRESKSGSANFRTALKNFAMIVTAEVLPGTTRPTELILFQSGKADVKTMAANHDFTLPYDYPFQGIVKPGNPSIATLKFSPGGEPIELMQARKAIELAESIDAGKVDEKSMKAAKIQLEQANASATKGGSKQVVIDYSRRAIESAGVATRLTYDKRVAEQEAAARARHQAAEEAKARELAAAKAQAGAATADAAASQAKANAAQAEKARLAAEVDRLKEEKDALRKGLEEAVGKTMAISQTARGLVINMADITFDVNKSTLKRDSEISIAKISGILAVFQKLNLRVEGYTDASGKEDLNMKLSAERARTVNDFLLAQGISQSRLTHAGYGPANPAATNDTAEGRRKNRRVELIIAEGPVQPTPGGVTAPERPAKPAAKPAAKAPAKGAPTK